MTPTGLLKASNSSIVCVGESAIGVSQACEAVLTSHSEHSRIGVAFLFPAGGVKRVEVEAQRSILRRREECVRVWRYEVGRRDFQPAREGVRWIPELGDDVCCRASALGS